MARKKVRKVKMLLLSGVKGIKIQQGYQLFRKKYALGDQSIMQCLSYYGQQPQIMVVACCDSRVDPALIMQCDPGDLFVVLGTHGRSGLSRFMLGSVAEEVVQNTFIPVHLIKYEKK